MENVYEIGEFYVIAHENIGGFSYPNSTFVFAGNDPIEDMDYFYENVYDTDVCRFKSREEAEQHIPRFNSIYLEFKSCKVVRVRLEIKAEFLETSN